MNKNSNELGFFEIETRLREIVSNLLAPVIKKNEENEVNIKNLINVEKQNEETMKNFESLLSNGIIKMVPNEEFNRKFLELYSDKRSTDTVFHMKIESLGSRVDFMNHQFSDMNSRMKNIEEITKHVRTGFDDITTLFREFKEKYTLKLEQLELAQINASEIKIERFETIEHEIRLQTSLIQNINQKEIPELWSSIEFQQKDLKELNNKFSPLLENRVFPGDLKKQKNQLDHEIKKTHTLLSNEVHNLREYLDKMLRIEINCGISDTLLQVLDPRQIKKLIPVVEMQFSGKEDEGTQMSPAFEMTTVTTEVLNKKTEDQYKKIEAKLTMAKRKLTKDLEKPSKSPTIKKLEITRIESPGKSPALSGERTAKHDLDIAAYTETKREDSIKLEECKMTPVIIESPALSSKKSPPIPPRVDSVMSSLKTDKSESFDQLSEISLDPIWVQEQINHLCIEMKISQQTREEVINLMNVCIEAMKIKVTEAQQEFSKTVLILNEELNQISKQRQKDLSDVYSYIDSNLVEVNERIVKLDNNDLKIVKINDALLGVVENEKIIFELMAQDEVDRKNIQLLGYSENKNSKTVKSKPVISFKPECLSCTGDNPLVYSAFKMACLSYSPSEVKYNSRVYARSALIERLGELINSVWNAGDAFGNKSRAVITNDCSSVRIKSHTRTRTTSRGFLDLTKLLSEHVTPQHSKRDFKYNISK